MIMDVSSVSVEYIYMGIFVLTLGALLGIISSAVSIWHKLKRTPPIDEVLRSNYITRSEFNQHIAEAREHFNRLEDDINRLENDIKSMRSYNAKTTRELFDEIRRMSQSFNKELQDINKAIGSIEGYLSNKG